LTTKTIIHKLTIPATSHTITAAIGYPYKI